ncbi:MAG: type IV pilus modification PilV family protein [Fluviibacter sp.]
MKCTDQRSAGFSLIEVLIALVVLGVGLMGLARLQLHLLASTADSAAYDHAVRLANAQLESLRFTRLTGGVPVSGADEQSVQGLVFSRRWTVNCTSGDLCQIAAQVRWREPRAIAGADTQEISLNAYIALPSGAAQGWLVQSGPPGREILP